MRAIDWQQFLQTQRDKYRKVLFTPTELANAAGAAPRSLSVTLGRLVARGVVRRYAAGRYGLPGAVTAADLVPGLDPSAYITGFYALYRHQLVTQAPVEITCFTNRRHNLSRVRTTSLGRIVFVCVAAPVYKHPEEGIVAPAEQALCDGVYACRKRGVALADIVTFRNLDRLDLGRIEDHLARYPESIRREVDRLLKKRASGQK